MNSETTAEHVWLTRVVASFLIVRTECLRQSKTLRKVSESLLQKSNDLGTSVKAPKGKGAAKHPPRRARKP